ncbi:N-acetylmuramoyl-L-alanine amidase [Gordonia sp. ABSL1-1]|uniref:N-acetylmuramoyl-L-alanine amidase n=1 Tax=Gordonia sp. ABSL1-1 TaxID=3053923 RepID=UPI0025730984|nr:N-acetylmuramoyl-L-alanine amidase [Gordonia sp. ABSL1-1]MDL9938674.1 N-acetylmuramoyl-L-alanine amidase [Gordonia sp. ABSL1-1]
MAAKPTFRDVNLLGPNQSNRWGARVINFFLHTEEGSATAENLARSGNNSGAFSYHYIVDDSTRAAMVNTDYGSWSVLDANPQSINLCFAGSRAAQSRSVWLSKFRNAIRIAAWTAVEDAKKYPYIRLVVNGRPYKLGRTACISDHNYVTVVLGIGTHTDVGPSFPWDVFEADLKALVTGAENQVVPPVNKINEIAAKSPWLGKRITTGEAACKDGVGRFAHFENGSVYWHPTTGARPIPKLLMEAYEALDWERGPLGYPTAFHSILPIATAPKVGDVQAFQGGVLYRRYGQPGFYVHGVIGARWAREGYEAGPLGWPISDEYVDGTGRRQDFENGTLVWDPSGAVKIEQKG